MLNRKGIIGEEATKRKEQIEDSDARKAERAQKKPGKAAKTDAQQDEDAAQRESDSLTKQIYLLAQLSEGERRASHEAQARYEIEQGAYVHASKAAKTKLMAEAKQLEAMEQERKKTEEAAKAKEDAQKAYDRLRDSLETVSYTHLDVYKRQIPNIVIGEAVVAGGQADDLGDIWGNDAILAYVAPPNGSNRRSSARPSYGYTLSLIHI